MFIKCRQAALVICLAISLAASACGSPDLNKSTVQVVAAIYPLAWLTEAIAGDRAEVTTLVPPGTEPHDFELKPNQMAQLNQSDIVIYQRGVAAAIDQAIERSQPKLVIETGQLVNLLPAGSDELTDDEDIPTTYGFNPHTWLDPKNMAAFAETIAEALATADPRQGEGYRISAIGIKDQLGQLNADFETGLSTCARRSFITSHAAFGYLARAYGLKQLPIAGISPEDEPGPQKLAELIQQAGQLGLTTVFFEPLISPVYAETLATETDLVVDVLDPIEGVTSASRGDDYISIMKANLAALRLANGCQ